MRGGEIHGLVGFESRFTTSRDRARGRLLRLLRGSLLLELLLGWLLWLLLLLRVRDLLLGWDTVISLGLRDTLLRDWLLLSLTRDTITVVGELAVLTVVAPTLPHELEAILADEGCTTVVLPPNWWGSRLTAWNSTRTIVHEAASWSVLAGTGVPEFVANLGTTVITREVVSTTPTTTVHAARWGCADNISVRADVGVATVGTEAAISGVTELLKKKKKKTAKSAKSA